MPLALTLTLYLDQSKPSKIMLYVGGSANGLKKLQWSEINRIQIC